MPRKRLNFTLPVNEPVGKVTPKDYKDMTGPERKQALDQFADLLLHRMTATDFKYLIGRLQEMLPTALNIAAFDDVKAKLEADAA